MKDNPWMEFLVFTRKERIAVLVLSLLIITSAIAPFFIPKKKFSIPDAKEFYALKNELDKLKASAEDSLTQTRNENDPWQNNYSGTSVRNSNNNFELFAFDPNKISAIEWKKLGLRDRTIGTIMKFRTKGGKFRQASDLKKIYGLREEEFRRLLPYVKFEERDDLKIGNTTDEKHRNYEAKAKASVPAHHSVEINKADTSTLIALPGIGSKLANRIINFRYKLGGFYSIEQLHEVYGLPDSTLDLVKVYLTCDPTLVNKININTADIELLKQHPYIKWNVANAIVQYRKEHGDFVKPEDLREIALIDEPLYLKVRHYFVLK